MQLRFQYFFSCLLFLFCFNAQGQYSKISKEKIVWEKKKVLVSPNEGIKKDLWTASNCYNTHDHPAIPVFQKVIDVPYNGVISTTIRATTTSDITLINNNDFGVIGSNFVIESKIVKDRSSFKAVISFIPIKNVTGRYVKLEAFELQINIDPINQIASKGPTFTNQSILDNGDIYKLEIKESGIYKLDYDFLKNALGIDIEAISPNELKIFGNPGGKIPERIEDNRIDDLQEKSVKLVGTQDGSFDPGDYLLFYAEESGLWSFNESSGKYDYQINPYDQANYCFLKISSGNGMRVSSTNSISGTAFSTDEQDYVYRLEEDRLNLLGSFANTEGTGQQWFFKNFSNERTQDFSSEFTIPDAVIGASSRVTMRFAARNSSSSTVRLNFDGNNFSRSLPKVFTTNIESLYATQSTLEEEFLLSSSNPQVIVEFPPSGDNQGWLDYIQLETKRRNIFSGGQMLVRNKQSISQSSATFELSLNQPGTDITIWDITDPSIPVEQEYDSKSNGLSFGFNPNNSLKNFIVFDPVSGPREPISGQKIENQNLHGTQRADMIIVTHPDFLTAAEQLADHRRTHNDFDVLVVNIEDIYNEFSAGKIDPTALRDFAKMVYDRDVNFRYLLLLGDGSYDYRGLISGVEYQNFVPAYETPTSLHPIDGFPSDDYYGLLSDSEGVNLSGALDVAIGRIPARSIEEAQTVVDKIIHYETSPTTLGEWRTKTTFVADDEDDNRHLFQNESISSRVEENHAEVNIQKIYYDSFVQESTPGGARYPDAKASIISAVERGNLIINYLGHGGPKGWSQERVLGVNDINNMQNYDKLATFITATCSFTGYDDPSLNTAGEVSIMNPSGAAVALFTTVRAVYISDNKKLAQSVFDTIYTKENGSYLKIGELLRRAKNTTTADEDNNRKFTLIGDPAMTLALPKFNVATHTINGVAVSEVPDTIRALQKVTITGSIIDDNGQIIDNFNGTLFPTIYDKKSKVKTLANDSDSSETTFEVRKNVIFKGAASVNQGQFSFSFVVPKDIDYAFGEGKVSYYASDGGTRDASGSFENLIIGGSDSNGITDVTGPVMDLYMNNEDFVTGGTTTHSPTLLVYLSDDNGINISGTSIGHDLTGVLDDDSQSSFVLNEFYESNIDDFTGGVVKYPLENLSLGPHKILVRAFDVANNATEGIIEFVVVDRLDGKLQNVYNYPNPFTTKTRFMFDHDLPGENLDILVQVYTMSGKLIKTIENTAIATGTRIDDVQWDGFDDFGSRLAKGIYLYKIKIKSSSNEFRESNFEKLVILK